MRGDGKRQNGGVDDTEASRTVHPSERQPSILEPVKKRYALQLVVHNTTLRAGQHGRAADPVRGTLQAHQYFVNRIEATTYVGRALVPRLPNRIRGALRDVEERRADDRIERPDGEHRLRLPRNVDRDLHVELVREQTGRDGRGREEL